MKVPVNALCPACNSPLDWVENDLTYECSNCGKTWGAENVNNPVDHPKYYTKGGIECIEAIKASMSVEEFQGYCKGNVLKYLWRWREKNGLEDLQKAQVYLGWLCDDIEKRGEKE